MAEATQEIAINYGDLTAEELRKAESFQDVLGLLQDKGIEILDASKEIGDGYSLLKKDDKARLIGIPMMLVSWQFSESEEYGGEFVSIRLITRNNDRLIVNDGSTGIYDQLRKFTDSHGGRQIGLYVPKGFRVSRYQQEYTDERTGEVKTRQAETYYLDASQNLS